MPGDRAQSSTRLSRACRLGAALLLTVAFHSAHADETSDLRDMIWAKERAIYGGRTAGTLGPYMGSVSADYLAWPPFAKGPFGSEALKSTTVRVSGAGERMTMELKGFTRSGNTALIYYAVRRTALGDGTPVDQTYENVHAWTREAGGWRLLGGMARLAPVHDR